MGRLLLWAGLTLLLQLQLGTAFKLVCYFTSWARYRPKPAAFFPKDIDPHLCTHLVYAFASMKSNRITIREQDDATKIYPQFMELKERNKELHILLSIGGWNFGTRRFTKMLKTVETRHTFISSVLKFLRQHGFDGLDLFFQYPTFRGSPQQDRQRFSYLLQELKTAFLQEAKSTKKKRLLVTAAVSGDCNIINHAYDIPIMARFLDYISVLTFDFHGSWEEVTGHNSPLLGGTMKNGEHVNCLTSEYAMNLWVHKGVPEKKLIMGLPTYGRTFRILPSGGRMGAPAFGPAKPGNYTQESGLWAHYEICTFLSKATYIWDNDQKVPFAYDSNSWVGFDDMDSYAFKVYFIMMKQFGGAMVWSLDLDDFEGSFCKLGRFPLVNLLKVFLIDGNQTSSRSKGSRVQGFKSTPPPPKRFQTTPLPFSHFFTSPVFTLTPEIEKTTLQEKTPAPLNITPYTSEENPHLTADSNIQDMLTLNFFISQLWKKNSSDLENVTIPLAGNSPPQSTHILKATTKVPDDPTTLHIGESTSPAGSTIPSKNFSTFTPLPQTTKKNTL